MLIIGAGPAGTSCAIELAQSGLSVAILDKASFPRDKTCGDALSVDVINQLSLLSHELAVTFDTFSSKFSSFGVKIVSPDLHEINIPFIHKGKEKCGYTCSRFDFDNLLVQYIKQFDNVNLIENCSVDKIELEADIVKAHSNLGIFSAPLIVGADGAHSVVAKQLGDFKLDKKHYSAGLRVYYEGVTNFHHHQYIELYFFKDILPGYLWVFPLPENKANVGIGMLSSEISVKKINLKETLQRLLSEHPELKLRFENAKPLESIKGYGLPLGSKKRKISGERFLLTGDAASLIDPFTGEGIGNAMRSGRVAAKHIIKCFDQNNFSSSFNRQFDEEIYRRMWRELKISRTLQQLCRYPWLFNFVVNKASQSKPIHQLLVDALAHVDKKESLLHPAFYFRIFFSR